MTSEARELFYQRLHDQYGIFGRMSKLMVNELLNEIDSRDRRIDSLCDMVTKLSNEAQKFVADSETRNQRVDEVVREINVNVRKLNDTADSQIQKLRELVKHCWRYSGHSDCGYKQMSAAQKELYESIVQFRLVAVADRPE